MKHEKIPLTIKARIGPKNNDGLFKFWWKINGKEDKCKTSKINMKIEVIRKISAKRYTLIRGRKERTADLKAEEPRRGHRETKKFRANLEPRAI